jgi:hypothetical protein
MNAEFAHRRIPPRRGYVLLMTLMLLAIAAAATASVCRISLERALQASRAEADLQRRWGTISCQKTLLPLAETVLSRGRAAEASMRFRLGGQEFQVIFGDEQAKANINAIYRRRGRSQTELAVRALAAAAGASPRVEVRPLDLTDAPINDEPPAFESFDQLFSARPQELLTRRGDRPALTELLTCWGDGTINFERVSAAALEQSCRPNLTAAQAKRLIAWRDSPRDQDDDAPADVWELIAKMKLSEAASEVLEERLAETSTCYSLWIIAGSGGERSIRLAVLDQDAAYDSRAVQFDW